MKPISARILQVAKSYLGQLEKPNNGGFVNPEFESEMVENGFNKGESWCTIFAKLVWRKAYERYNSNLHFAMNELFSESAVKTFHNFEKSKLFGSTKAPEPGALVVWQNYRNGEPHWTGHIGIFKEYAGGKIITIDGNSNEQGVRNGDRVIERARAINYNAVNGFRLLGFINPK